VRGERSPVVDRYSFEFLNHGPRFDDALLYIRLEPGPDRVVVRLVPCVLQFDEEGSKVLEFLAESLLRTGGLSTPTIALSEARAKALRPRRSAYDLRDARLRAFGVRVLPSGARRFFIHTQHRG